MSEPGPDDCANQYERPNQPWVCGLAAGGHACAAGPTDRGHCPALAECAPRREGDRWRCNRSALRGGPCDDGPTPDGRCGRVQKCRPVRSLRARRQRFVVACLLATLGMVVIVLCSPWRERALRPGPLAQQHAQLLENSPGKAPSCGACHAAVTQNVPGWTLSLVTTSPGLPTQSKLCMNCHSKSISHERSLAAHNLSAATLQQLSTQQLQTAENVTIVSAAGDTEPSAVACAQCHREHHGAKANLTAVDNGACQACHQRRYVSFATDHPDFGVWPYVRRTRIAFNHASHRGKHFVEKKQDFACRACHVSDLSGAVEQTASYEATCASCHDEKISNSVGRGVPMFALPTIDVEALRAAGHDVGAWPEAATGDFDGRLPAAMKLLLAGDAAASEAMSTLGANFEFQDVDPEDQAQLAASARLAAAIKTLLQDVCARGPEEVRKRLTVALGRDVSAAEVAALTAGLSIDTMRASAQWVEAPADENRSSSPTSPLVKMTDSYGPAGAWSQDAATFAIRYLPAVHADPVLAAWIKLLADTPQLEQRPIAFAMFKELTKSTTPGLCASCHSVERGDAGRLTVNWQATDRTAASRGLTKFTHAPHLVMPQLNDCASCHAIDDTAATATAYVDSNPRQFVSDFQPLTKRQCAECHTHTAAGDSCQACHNYHVDSVEMWRLEVPASAVEQRAERLRMSEFVRPVGTAHQ